MSALISGQLPLKRVSAAHKITARGYPASVPGAGHARNAHESTVNARVHSFARCLFLRTEAAKPGASIAANLKELGYGG